MNINNKQPDDNLAVHLRRIHFIVVIVCFSVVVTTESDSASKVRRAIDQLDGIIRADDTMRDIGDDREWLNDYVSTVANVELRHSKRFWIQLPQSDASKSKFIEVDLIIPSFVYSTTKESKFDPLPYHYTRGGSWGDNYFPNETDSTLASFKTLWNDLIYVRHIEADPRVGQFALYTYEEADSGNRHVAWVPILDEKPVTVVEGLPQSGSNQVVNRSRVYPGANCATRMTRHAV